MEEVTIILTVAALLGFALALKFPNRVPQMFTLVLSVCAVSAVFQDSTIADNLVYLIAFPLLTVALFEIGSLCIIKDGSN